MKLTSEKLDELRKDDYLLVDGNKPNLDFAARKQVIFTNNLDIYPAPILFIDPSDRLDFIEHIHGRCRIERKNRLYFKNTDFLFRPVGIQLFLYDPEFEQLPLPVFLTLDVLESCKVFHAVKKNPSSFIGFDIYISSSAELNSNINCLLAGRSCEIIVNR